MSRDAGARVRWVRWAAVIAATSLIAAGCGSDDDDDGAAGDSTTAGSSVATDGSTAPTSGSTAPTGGSTTLTGGSTAPGSDAETVTDFAAYVGGSGAADTSLDPIKVGYISQEGGPVEVGPTHDDGADIAVTFINEQGGGIGGQPLELVKCYIASTEEEGQQCARRWPTTQTSSP